VANWNDINNAFSAKLSAEWATTDIAWDNAPYEPTSGQEFIRGTMVPVTTENASLADSVKHFGIYTIQVFVPLQAGSGRAYELTSALEAIFTNTEFSEVVCYAADTTRTGDDGNGWYQVNLNVNFWSYERNV
jgi:hypothetical protein